MMGDDARAFEAQFLVRRASGRSGAAGATTGVARQARRVRGLSPLVYRGCRHSSVETGWVLLLERTAATYDAAEQARREAGAGRA
jgi:hypothetical protein